jgi:hypothetical protein
MFRIHINSARESLHHVHVGNVPDISEIFALPNIWFKCVFGGYSHTQHTSTLNMEAACTA